MKPRHPNPASTGTPSSGTNVARDDRSRAATEVNDVSLKDEVDTLRLVALDHNEKLELVETVTDKAAPHFDPYNKSGLMPTDNKPRKSIDDLRKLSAEIAKTKSYTRKDK